MGPTRPPARRQPRSAAAVDEGEAVLPFFVLDPGCCVGRQVRTAWLMASLHALDADLRDAGGPGLSVVAGSRRGPAAARPRQAAPAGAHQRRLRARTAAAATTGPGGARERGDRADGHRFPVRGRAGHPAQQATAGLPGVHARSTAPGWSRASTAGRRPSAGGSTGWRPTDRVDLPTVPDLTARAGEQPAPERWRGGCDRDRGGPTDYEKLNNFPGADATSHLSIALRWGHLHPRTRAGRSRRRNGPRAAAHWPGSWPGGTSSPTCSTTGPTR